MRNNFLILLILFITVANTGVYSQSVDFAEGVKQFEDQQYQKAKSIFTALTLSDTSDCRSLFYLGRTYSVLQKPDSADLCYSRIAKVNPKNPYAYLGNGVIALKAKNIETAMDLFKQATKSSKKDPVIYSLITESYLNLPTPDTTRAANTLLEFEKLHVQNPLYFISKAKYDMAKGENGKAASDYEWAFFYDPQNEFAYTNLGKIYSDGLLYKESLAALNKSIEIDPDQAMVYKHLGDLYYRFGKYPEAKKAYQKYLAVAEVNTENMEKYGIILFYNKEFKAAADEMEKIMLLDPSNPVMNRITAYVDYETADYENGMKYITKLFELHDESKLIALDYLYYGKLLLKTGNDMAGIENIRKALEMDDAKTDAYIDLAAALSKNKQHDDAIAVYEKLVVKGIDKSATYFRIGKEYYYKGVEHKDLYDSTKTIKATTGLNTSGVDLPVINDSIIANECYTKADSFFNLVTQISPDYFGAHLWRGRVLSLIDSNMEKGLAKDPYERVLSILLKDNLPQNKNTIIECYKYLGAFFYLKSEANASSDKAQSKLDKTTAIDYYQKIMALDPGDTKSAEILDQLINPPKPQSKPGK
jgi:tetratricopeptide (TPR) repeat protein